MIIRPEPLTKEAFLPFGDVLETEGVNPESINSGSTLKYAGLAELTLAAGGVGQISIYRSKPVELPFRIRMMECHPLGSQAFYPLHDRSFPVVVAPAGCVPGADTIRVFLTNGRQGLNLHVGCWHHYQLTLGQVSDYIVVDRGGGGDNCREYPLQETILIDI